MISRKTYDAIRRWIRDNDFDFGVYFILATLQVVFILSAILSWSVRPLVWMLELDVGYVLGLAWMYLVGGLIVSIKRWAQAPILESDSTLVGQWIKYLVRK